MYHRRYFITDTHVRSAVIIEMYEPSDYFPCMFDTMIRLAGIDLLRLDDSVYPFSHSVVRRLVVLGHTDTDMVLLKNRHIIVTTILHSTVGVMDQTVQRHASRIGNRHF